MDEQLINQLVNLAKSGGLQLTGEGGLLQRLTKRLLEFALGVSSLNHRGYGKHARSTGCMC